MIFFRKMGYNRKKKTKQKHDNAFESDKIERKLNKKKRVSIKNKKHYEDT